MYLCVLLAMLCSLCCCCVFFFQAEDGIRDLVRSRGLGDVYKRQHQHACAGHDSHADAGVRLDAVGRAVPAAVRHSSPVSYTHLTLPTSDLV